jgi:hypothetical protein
MKLVAFFFKQDLANDKAFFACLFALLIQFDRREFFFERDVLFFGTAIF